MSKSGSAEAAQSQDVVSSGSGGAAFGGPTIAGLCVLDRQRIFNGSKVGRDANGHYKELRSAVQSQVNADFQADLCDLI